MSRYCGETDTASVLEAAIHWRDDALLGGRSVFSSDPIWTTEALQALDTFFVQQPDEGKGKFLEKLHKQLDEASSAAKRLAAEMMWLMYLCPSSLTPEHKRRTVQAIWSWSGQAMPESPWLSERVLKGIGSAGPGFNQNQWRELVFSINFAQRFQALQPDRQQELLADAWAFDEWLKEVPDWEARQLRHMLLYLLFPDTFERIFGQNDRRTIARHFSQRDKREVTRMNPIQLDRELQAIRRRLEVEQGTEKLDFYVPPLRERWSRDTIQAATEGVTAHHVRQALEEIDKDGVPEDAESTGYDLVERGRTYPPKLVLSLAVKYATGEPLERSNFSGGEQSSAFRLLRKLGFKIEPKRSEGDLEQLLEQFLSQAKDGTDLQVRSYLKEYRGLRVKVSFGQTNFARIPWVAFLGEGQSASQGIYPVLLYFRDHEQLLLCYGVSETAASAVNWGILDAPTVRDWFTQNLRQRPDRYGTSYVAAAYDVSKQLPVQELRQTLDQLIERYERVLSGTIPGALITRETPQEALPANVDLGAAATAFSEALRVAGVSFGLAHEDLVSAFLASVLTKPLVILTGLSGSGKTQIALRFGEWLGPDRLYVAAVRPDWTGPESLFGYEDGLKPHHDGQPAWSAPPVLDFMLRAARDPQHPYLLLLDEMNLAHVERYFADVLSGMESAHACLPDVQRGSDGIWRLRSAGARVPFPRNLWIVGTVNVDETTYMFSPKVLDRANTFEFRVETADLSVDSRKPHACSPGDQALIRGLLSVARDDDWHATNAATFHADLAARLKQLHGVLSRYNLEFGHRVYFEALRFAALAEEVGLSEQDDVLDRIVMQKVLPRLHGSRRRLELPLLALAHFCASLPDAVESDDRLPMLGLETEPTGGSRLPLSYEKLIRMLRALRANQFASFTE